MYTWLREKYSLFAQTKHTSKEDQIYRINIETNRYNQIHVMHIQVKEKKTGVRWKTFMYNNFKNLI